MTLAARGKVRLPAVRFLSSSARLRSPACLRTLRGPQPVGESHDPRIRRARTLRRVRPRTTATGVPWGRVACATVDQPGSAGLGEALRVPSPGNTLRYAPLHHRGTGDSFPGFWGIGHFGPEEWEGWAVPRQHRAGIWDTERCGMTALHRARRPASAASAHLRRPAPRGRVRLGPAGAMPAIRTAAGAGLPPRDSP